MPFSAAQLRLYAAGLTLFSLALLGALFFFKPTTLVSLVQIAAFTLALFSAGATLQFQRDVRRRQRANDPRRIIARYRIPPDTWHAFCALDRDWDTQYRNLLSRQQNVPPDGLELIATRDSLRIGSSWTDLGTIEHSLAGIKWLETQPRVVETWGRGYYRYSSALFALRFPADPSSHQAAAIVAAWLGQLGFLLPDRRILRQPTPARLRIARNVSLILLAGGLALVLYQLSQPRGLENAIALSIIPTLALILLAFCLFSLARIRRLFARHQWTHSWRVPASTWRRFADSEVTRPRPLEEPLNLLDPLLPLPWRGIRIRLAPDAIQIGDLLFDFSYFAPDGILSFAFPPADPPTLDVRGRYRTPGGVWGPFALRFPIEPSLRNALEGALRDWKRAA